MLGRHVYRVRRLETGDWNVLKDGEAMPRGSRVTREEASAFAWDLAAADEPSKVIVEGEGGEIADERSFGVDAGVDPAAWSDER